VSGADGARVGVAVVHFGAPGPTSACVAALAGDPSPVDRRIVVVDNGGNLHPDAVPSAEIVPSRDNPGFGQGANRGAAALDPSHLDALVILNHDVEVLPGFLAAAVGAVRTAGVAAASGPLYLDDARTRPWYAGGGVCFATGTVWQSRSPADAARRRRVGFLPGAALAVVPAVWTAVGGFDRRFFLYHEDLDLCLRMRRRGLALLFEPGMAAVHRLGGATGSAGRSALYLEHLTATRLRPFRPLAYRLYLAGLHSLYAGLRALSLALGGGAGASAARAVLRGHRRALATIGEGPLP
jgi:N-acetylglucosaminyl-diphospho-decaprenol L-rhamnosyltransferase